MTKKCWLCGLTKQLSEFGKNRSKKDGHCTDQMQREKRCQVNSYSSAIHCKGGRMETVSSGDGASYAPSL